MEQSLRNSLSRKEKEVERLNNQLSSMRVLADEQRKLIEQLKEELDYEAECRVRCEDLQSEVRKQVTVKWR